MFFGRPAMDISVRTYLEEGVIDRLVGARRTRALAIPHVRHCRIIKAFIYTQDVKGDAN